MYGILQRAVIAIVLVSVTLGAVPAYKREKKDNIASFETLAAAHYLACPELFGTASITRYRAVMSSPRDNAEFRRAAEFEPAKRDAMLETTRREIRERAQKTYRSDQTYTLKNVEFRAGTYDVTRQGIEFRFAKSVVVWVQQPGPGEYLYSWAELRSGTELPPASVMVFPEYAQGAPFVWERDLVAVVPVSPSVAEEFAAAYPPSRRNNLDNDGRRKALAYLDIQVTGCKDADPRVTFERGVTAKVVGIRIYAMSTYDLSAQGLVFEWHE